MCEYGIQPVRLNGLGEDGQVKSIAYFIPCFAGILFRHPQISVDKTNSTCCDQFRKNRTTSEWVVCLNQAMQVYTELNMLLSGVPTTNDGCHIIRHEYPVLFEALFDQIPTVSQSFPFTLDMQLVTGIKVALVGHLDPE